jgi:hypothetical protein
MPTLRPSIVGGGVSINQSKFTLNLKTATTSGGGV